MHFVYTVYQGVIILETIVKKQNKKTRKKVLAIIGIILLALIAAKVIAFNWHSNPKNIKTFESDNSYIMEMGKTQISAHRSGGGIMPEETLKAFKNCAENPEFKIDVFEFDLHITKDNVLVLLHDDTLDRTSNSAEIFGKEEARPEDYTYEELRTLNMGAKFTDEDGNMPYADIDKDNVPDDIKILRIEDVLDYLTSVGNYNYIIEIKNSGELGMKGVDILYNILVEKNLLDKVIFGSFHEEVSQYVDEHHPDLLRSATINEVITFWLAALRNDKNFNPNYSVLQIPYSMPFKLAANLGTAQVINYAHEKGIAVQYWTINSEKDMEYLLSVGADCIMTDYPDKLYEVDQKNKNQ